MEGFKVMHCLCLESEKDIKSGISGVDSWNKSAADVITNLTAKIDELQAKYDKLVEEYEHSLKRIEVLKDSLKEINELNDNLIEEVDRKNNALSSVYGLIGNARIQCYNELQS